MVANEVFSSRGNAAWVRRKDDDPVDAKGYIGSIRIMRLRLRRYIGVAIWYGLRAAGAT